nr:ROK family transcriptional regulator [Chloroflexota bacterium]
MATASPFVARKVDGQSMQQANRALVLALIRHDPTLSRASIARQTTLSPASVSGIVDHLIREGFVREEAAAATGTVGRRPMRLVFNPAARVTLGIAIDVRDITAGLVDLGGKMRATQRAPIAPEARPAAIVDTVAQVARRALRGVDSRDVLGVGVAVPGLVRWPDGVILFSPNLGWRDVPIQAMLEERLGRPVLVDNEVRALALAEHSYGAARGARTVVVIDAAYGVGGAVIIDGALYRGVHGAAGEVGHNIVEPNGAMCGCGNRGCLETVASAHGLVARATDALVAGRASALTADASGGLTLDHIVAAARAGDALACELLARAATYLGLAVANAIDNWDPERVVLSGPVALAVGNRLDDALIGGQRAILDVGR